MVIKSVKELRNIFAEECVPIRCLRTDLQFQISLFRRRMFGHVDRSGGHESVRILRQSCSLGYFLQAWVGVRLLLSFSRFVGSIEV